jgi:4-hydroxy-tetrahydrodipicolinate reductase
MSEVALVLVGAGPVGVAAARAAMQIGAGVAGQVVDPDEGRRREVATELEATPYASVDELGAVEGGVAIAAFSSNAAVVAPVVEKLLSLGYSVVTTCEELADPHPETRQRLDLAARGARQAIVATGANPGFVMDRFPLLLASASTGVVGVKVLRRLDTRLRRGPLVAKTGKGLTPDSFADRAAEGSVGHVGLEASLRLLAAGMGWPTDPVEVSIEPVLDAAGLVAGQHQVARLVAPQGYLEYELIMASTVDESIDEVVIEGEPPIHAVLVGGYHGDTGTSARVARAVAAIPRLSPGFYGPTDLPLWA